jgi:hypothetical protein
MRLMITHGSPAASDSCGYDKLVAVEILEEFGRPWSN